MRCMNYCFNLRSLGWCGRVGKAITPDAKSVEFKSQRRMKKFQTHIEYFYDTLF